MILHKNMVSFYLTILFLATLQVCTCVENEVGGGDNKSVEGMEDETDHDEKLIRELLDAPIGNPDQDSDVSRILKILEAAEQASTTTSTTTTTPKPTTPEPTTTTSSPFFKTERPMKFSDRLGKPDNLNDMIAYLDKSFKETQQELGRGDENKNENDTNVPSMTKRSDYHHHDPPINKLLWGTARAVWDVSRPVFYKTSVGRKVGLVHDTLTLPLRTFGAIKHKIHDLTHHPYGYERTHRSILWDHDHHHHGGWNSGSVYVKYEPENSLFKSWLRYIYRAIKPAVFTKVYLKSYLLRVKLRFLYGLVRRVLAAKLHLLKKKFRPNLVVLKESKGWGHDHHHGHHHHHHETGWDSGWKPGPPPAPPTPAPSYGPPKYQPPPPISYGPPAASGYDSYKSWGSRTRSAPHENYEAPSTDSYSSSIAYNKDNTYSNYHHDEMMAQASDSDDHGSASAAGIETPSYAQYLQQLGIDPANLAELNPSEASAAASTLKEMLGRNLRQSGKNSEDVPYLVSESSSKDKTAEVVADKSPISRMYYVN